MNKEYYKLVRDNIPNEITDSGCVCTFRKPTSDEELYKLRKQKVLEELTEFRKEFTRKGHSIESMIEEMADLVEVFSNYLYGDDFDIVYFINRLQQAIKDKQNTKGGFTENYVLLNVSSLDEPYNKRK